MPARAAIEMGEIIEDTASEEITDEFLLFAIKSGLLTTWAEGFPDPRASPEIGIHVLLAAMIAARACRTLFHAPRPAMFFARRAWAAARSRFRPSLRAPGQGISLKGTGDDAPPRPPTCRACLLVKMESVVEMTASGASPLRRHRAERGGQDASRPSRRSVKKPLDEAEAERRGWAAVQALLAWRATCVGPSLVRARLRARLKSPGPRRGRGE
jgi:hypothetical protein